MEEQRAPDVTQLNGGSSSTNGIFRRQLTVFGALLVLYAVLTFLTYAAFPLQDLTPSQLGPPPAIAIPGWQLGLANAGAVLVVYGAAGLIGYWMARRVGWPGVFRERAGWQAWIVVPMAAGLGLGVGLVILDRLVQLFPGSRPLPHPIFPLSLVASAAAGIGEETLFRAFVLGLWALVFYVLLRRWLSSATRFWMANVLAALAFGAAHLPAAMLLFGVTNPAQVPAPTLAEIFVLNGVLGLVAGVWYRRVGLVAAVSIHFWADVIWHVVWPLLAL